MERHFLHQKTYRFEVLNESSHPKTVIYVLHGYGQLVKFFIRKFNHLSKDLLIVAPEGMHRFYLTGNSGRVGASWMTKEARELDIQDNIKWLDQLDKEICRDFNIERRFVLGFSQGGSTAMRWAMHGNTKMDGLIVWASDFPPDEIENKDLLKKVPTKEFTIGFQDEYYSMEDQKQLFRLYESADFKISSYIGNHDIERDQLSKLIDEFCADN